jgi:hypothetical protein
MSEQSTPATVDAAASASAAPRWTRAVWLLIPLVLSTAVHHGILRNYFFSDDFLNLYRIKNAGLLEYLLTPHGGHTLVLRNLLFYVFVKVFDTAPPPYFLLVLLTHLVNVVLLFFVLARLTGSDRLACFGATLWGAAPIQAGTLGWYSVYGHAVAGTLLLVILDIVSRAAAAGVAPSRRALNVCYALALLATVSFGVGVGFALALPLVVAWLAPDARRAARWGLPLWSLWLAVPLLYLGLFLINGLFFGEGLETPNTLVKFALQYWAIIPLGLVHMIAYGVMQLALSFAFAASGGAAVVSYAVVGALALFTALALWRSPAPIRRAVAAAALLALSCYAIIVAGRVVFFKSYTDAVMAMQPRYHYAALIPLTLLICLLLGQLGVLIRVRAWMANALLFAWLALLGAAYANFGYVTDHHDVARRQTEQVLGIIRTRLNAKPPGADVFIENRSFAGLPLVPKPIFPGWAGVFVIYYPSNTVDGRRVHFVDKELAVGVASARGKRSAGLVVPPP